MSAFVEYDHTQPQQFGGVLPEPSTAEDAAALILPLPFDRTTSYVTGTKFGPSAILSASAQVELWDEELGIDIHRQGLCTLPELDLSAFELDDAIAEIRRVASVLQATDKFIVTLGGEHSITPPLVDVAASRHRDLTVLQIDAHADLRPAYLGQRNSHACAMRRSLEYAPLVQVGIRNISVEEADVLPTLNTQIFYDWNMRADPSWMDRVVDALSDHVYLTIDLDGLEPGMMPAVGTPEPGGLSWRELTALLRKTFERRKVVACDVVELCPIPGMASPNFIAAKLVYKILTYKLGLGKA